MRSKPTHLGEISLDFAEIPPRRDENFPHKQTQVGQPSKEDRVFGAIALSYPPPPPPPFFFIDDSGAEFHAD